ncbi:hypothetical protein MNBD_ALPHA09-1458 [hydrothermal vent metagenome]|uniref:SURF1-like protein n=1 Tax=hydrothermal vent metagenome TaxID=652676 RepID=A0A3B0T9A3_9ZZZZ
MAGRTRIRSVALGLLSVLAIAGLIALGAWQVHWMQWQDRLYEQGKIVAGSELATITDIEAGFEYGFDVNILRVQLNGFYRHDLERYVAAAMNGEPGFRVLTPFIEELGYVVLVDRGWVSEVDRAPQSRSDPRAPEGKISITGITRVNAVSRFNLLPQADLAKKIWFWFDRPGLIASLPTGLGETADGQAGLNAMLFVQLEPGGEPGDGRLPLVGPPEIKSGTVHLLYAIGLFSLAAILAATTVRCFWRRRRKARKTGHLPGSKI